MPHIGNIKKFVALFFFVVFLSFFGFFYVIAREAKQSLSVIKRLPHPSGSRNDRLIKQLQEKSLNLGVY